MGREGDIYGSVDMKLFTQMEEEAGRFTGETAHRGKDKVGSNQLYAVLMYAVKHIGASGECERNRVQ